MCFPAQTKTSVHTDEQYNDLQTRSINELKSIQCNKPAFLEAIRHVKKVVQRHRLGKDINIKFKTPMTLRNMASFNDNQAVEDACNPARSNRKLRISQWIGGVQKAACSS